MQANTVSCKLCKGEMSMQALDPIEGEDHGVRMRIEGMPALQCAAGHKRFVTPDFAIKMMQALAESGELVPLDAATEKGLFRKRFCCPGCGQELESGGSDRVVARRPIEITGLERFDVQLEVPKFRCASCGRECVEPQRNLANDLMKASVHAFQAASVTPT